MTRLGKWLPANAQLAPRGLWHDRCNTPGMNASLTFLTLASFATVPASLLSRLAALPLPSSLSPMHALTGFIAVATLSIVWSDYSRTRGFRLPRRNEVAEGQRNSKAAHPLAA